MAFLLEGVLDEVVVRIWLEHFRDLLRRGLRTPLTVTTGGVPGLINAGEAIQPEAERLGSWACKMRIILDKASDESRSIHMAHLEAIHHGPVCATGQGRPVVLAEFTGDYLSAMRSLADGLEASLAHLKLPAVHRRHGS